MTSFLNKIKAEIKKVYQAEYVKILSVFLLFFFSFSLVYFSLDRFPSLDDPFFHIRFAEIVRERGLNVFSDFHWLYFSKISDNQSYFIYYNFLFYLILIPFTFIQPLFLGLKLFGVIAASLSFSLLFYVLLKMRIKYAFFWVIFVVSLMSYGSIMKLLVTRPFTLAPAFLILLLYFAYQKKYWPIFVLSIIYFFWHTATFFFPLLIVGSYFIFENFYGKKLDWRLIVVPSAGIILAFTATFFFAPGLFSYMKEIIFGVLYDTIIGKKINLVEGNEVYPINVFDFFKNNTALIFFLIIAFVFEIFNYIERKKRNGRMKEFSPANQVLRSSLFFLSLLFLLGTFLSGRNGDFLLFFSAVYIAVTFDSFIQAVSFRFYLIKKASFVGLILASTFLFVGNLLFIHGTIASGGAYNAIEGSAKWLEQNTEKGEVVFNPTWNWFTILFYYNTHNNYIAGIEPRFFYDYDSELYWKWWNISNNGFLCVRENCDSIKAEQKRYLKSDENKKKWYNQEGDMMAEVILNDFKSRHIITSTAFVRLNEVMDNSGRFEKVYTDNLYNTFFVYRIKE